MSSAPSSLSHALWEHYTVFDGLAGMRVENLHQDRNGFLWVATADGGVSRFDGVHFDNLTGKDGLPHPTVMAIAETGDGRVWFGTFGGGLAAWDGRAFQVYTTAHGLPADEILGLHSTPDGSLWVTTTRGVGRWAADRCVETIDRVRGEPVGPVYDLAQDGQGRLWLATAEHGVISADGQRLRDPGPQGEERLVWAWSLAIDSQGRLWIAPKYTGPEVYVYCCDPREEHLERVVAKEGVTTGVVQYGVRHLRVDQQDRVWIAHRGILVFDGGVWQSLTVPVEGVGLADTRLSYQDQEGNVWVGFWGGGLAFCDRWSVQRFTPADGLPAPEVLGLAEDAKGRLWIGTLGGLACMEGNRISSRSGIPGWPSTMVLSLLVDQQDRVWWGTAQGEVYRWDGDSLHCVEIARGEHEIKALCEGQSGRLWVGAYTGVLGWLEEGGFRPLEAHLPWLQVLAEDQEGRLWIGRHGAAPSLYCCEEGQVRAVEHIVADNRYVYALCQTPDHTLWVGTGTGLFAWRGGQAQQFTVEEGLSENAVSALALDAKGGLWIGTSGGGAAHYDARGFQAVRLGNTPAENVVEAILVDHQGGVWFGTRAGLVRYRPGSTPPRVVIRQVTAGQVYTDPQSISCTAPVPEVRMEFQGIGFRAGSRHMRYSCRLLGLAGAEEWSVFTNAAEAVYTGLPPGDYCFEVQAMDRDGLCSAPASLKLAILPDPQAEHLERLAEVMQASTARGEFIGESPALEQARVQLQEVARSDLLVLIAGETGTGKGLAARMVHEWSPRQKGKFIEVNCGGLSRELIGSELFGHEKGAFTSAVARKLGLFELAHRGTIFLDEIGDLPLEEQAHLLQVLDKCWIQRVGGTQTIPVDVRVVAATNRDLAREVKEGRFREDLYYRLAVVTVYLPPLRERREDIPLLARHFTGRFAAHIQRAQPSLTQEALARLETYPWPGNVRELQHVVQQAVLRARGGKIRKEDIALGSGELAEKHILTLEEQERQYLAYVLEATKGVIHGEHGAARLLGVPPSTLRSRLKKLGLKYGRGKSP